MRKSRLVDLFQFALCAEAVFDTNDGTVVEVPWAFQFALCAEAVFDEIYRAEGWLVVYVSIRSLR